MVTKWPRLIWCLFFTLLCAFSSPTPPVSAGPLAAEVVQVFFSPNGGATDAVVSEIGNARIEILVQPYSFTSAPTELVKKYLATFKEHLGHSERYEGR